MKNLIEDTARKIYRKQFKNLSVDEKDFVEHLIKIQLNCLPFDEYTHFERMHIG